MLFIAANDYFNVYLKKILNCHSMINQIGQRKSLIMPFLSVNKTSKFCPQVLVLMANYLINIVQLERRYYNLEKLFRNQLTENNYLHYCKRKKVCKRIFFLSFSLFKQSRLIIDNKVNEKVFLACKNLIKSSPEKVFILNQSWWSSMLH